MAQMGHITLCKATGEGERWGEIRLQLGGGEVQQAWALSDAKRALEFCGRGGGGWRCGLLAWLRFQVKSALRGDVQIQHYLEDGGSQRGVGRTTLYSCNHTVFDALQANQADTARARTAMIRPGTGGTPGRGGTGGIARAGFGGGGWTPRCAYCVLVPTRPDSYAVIRLCLSDKVTRSTSLDRFLCRPRTLPSAFVHSILCPGACAHHCMSRSTRQDRPGAPRACRRSSCGMRPDRTHSGSSCGSARICRWSAVTAPSCVCDRCRSPPGTAGSRAARLVRNTHCPDRSGCAAAAPDAPGRTAAPDRSAYPRL